MAPIRLGESLELRKMAVGPSAPPMMAIPAACEGSKKLCRGTNEHQLRIGQQGREIGHGTDAQEDQRRIPALAHTLIENVEYGVVFIESDLQAGIGTEGDVAEDDTQSDGYEQQWLEVLLNGEPDEEGSHCNHDEVPDSGIGKGRIGQELLKILYDKLS